MSKEKRKRKRFGEYEVAFHNDNREEGFTVFGPRTSGGFWVPSDEKLARRYCHDLLVDGRMSRSLISWLGYRAVIEINQRSLVEGKNAVGLPIKNSLTYEQAKQVLSEFFAEDSRRKNSREGLKPNRLIAFQRQHRSMRTAICRRFGGVRRVMEDVYPGLYLSLHRADNFYREIDVEELRRELLARFYNGLSINRTALMHSPYREERRIGNAVLILANRGWQAPRLFPSTGDWTKAASKISGLREDEISVPFDSRKAVGSIAERLTTLLINWAFVLGMDVREYVPEKEEVIAYSVKKKKFYYDDETGELTIPEEEGIADLRIGNQAVEVKAGYDVSLGEKGLREILCKYTPGKNRWESGEVINDSLVVFHQPERVYGPVLHALRQAGIRVMCYDEFHNLLEEVVRKIGEKYPTYVEEIRPRIHDLTGLLRLHEEISLRPVVFCGRADSYRRQHAFEIVGELITAAEAERLFKI